MTMPHLLPSNASPFEVAQSQSFDMLPRLDEAINSISYFKSVPGDSILPFLIWEYGLGGLQAYLRDPRRAIREGIRLHRLKGTPASLKAALALYGYGVSSAPALAQRGSRFLQVTAQSIQDAPSGIVIEETGPGPYWATYQLGLPQIADEKAVRHIVSICNEMAPARCRLWRVYTDIFDRRPIVLSEGPVLGDGWLSFYSGTHVPLNPDTPDSDTIVVSFGTRYGWQSPPYLEAAACASFGSTVHLGFLAPYIDRFMVGRSRLSDVYPRNHGFAMDSFFSILWADRATAARRWRGEWDARRWLDYTGFDRKLPRWRMARRQTSRAQLVPGWGETLSDHNARLGATFATVINNPPRLGSFRLSDHDPQRRELRLHEMFLHTNAATVPPVKPGIPQTSGAALLASSAPVPDPHCVQQARHDELAAHMQPREALPPQAAASLHLAAQSISVSPCAAPPFAVTSYHAPQWQGAWTELGRTWRTSKFISRY